ncbi:MAG: PEP-CTERM sorting domain-containing protein [Gammaproteobacteria bacterium]
MLRRIFIVLAILILPITSQATLVDFTDRSWSIVEGSSAVTSGNVSLSSTGGLMTFNAWDNGGCLAGQAMHGLSCDGDGIGIGNDEISEQGNTAVAQSITVSFGSAVNVNNIYLLDLFGYESGTSASGSFLDIGEKAVINGITYWSLGINNPGGFFSTNFSGQGMSSIVFSGYDDFFSDYAIAAIDVSTVPLPGAIFLFGTALLGFMGFRRNS